MAKVNLGQNLTPDLQQLIEQLDRHCLAPDGSVVSRSAYYDLQLAREEMARERLRYLEAMEEVSMAKVNLGQNLTPDLQQLIEQLDRHCLAPDGSVVSRSAYYDLQLAREEMARERLRYLEAMEEVSMAKVNLGQNLTPDLQQLIEQLDRHCLAPDGSVVSRSAYYDLQLAREEMARERLRYLEAMEEVSMAKVNLGQNLTPDLQQLIEQLDRHCLAPDGSVVSRSAYYDLQLAREEMARERLRYLEAMVSAKLYDF